MPAIQVHGAGRLAVSGIRSRVHAQIGLRVQFDTVPCISLMLVVVMTEMLDPNPGLVPAIRSYGRPGDLEQQEGKQDNSE